MQRVTAALVLITIATTNDGWAQVHCDANGPYLGVVDEPIAFDGTGSISEGGTIVSYEWEFGDGTTGKGPMPIHSYVLAGAYTVTLIVMDDDNFRRSCITKAEVRDAAPIDPASWGRIKSIYQAVMVTTREPG